MLNARKNTNTNCSFWIHLLQTDNERDVKKVYSYLMSARVLLIDIIKERGVGNEINSCIILLWILNENWLYYNYV